MKRDKIKTDTAYDNEFKKVQRELNKISYPEDFARILDYASRIQNIHGFGKMYILKLYLIGYLEGKNNTHAITNDKDMELSEVINELSPRNKKILLAFSKGLLINNGNGGILNNVQSIQSDEGDFNDNARTFA